MKPIITLDDYRRAAKELRCQVSTIRAVAETESNGRGFLMGSLLKVRFEGHVFRQKTGGKFDLTHPTLSHRYMVDCPYNQGTVKDWLRVEQARKLAGDIAFDCASYGMFQTMGYHARLLNYTNAYAMVQAYNQSEGVQLDAFVTFNIKKGLDEYLRKKDFDRYSYYYNGENYAAGGYHTKMRRLDELYSVDN